uniref:Uncharacterized protein n=1 Tax=Parascaris univalens TaxID=6257 RepID=A0A915A3W5_PARUN
MPRRGDAEVATEMKISAHKTILAFPSSEIFFLHHFLKPIDNEVSWLLLQRKFSLCKQEVSCRGEPYSEKSRN